MLCDWGMPHARPDKLQQQSGVQEVEGMPVGWLARACSWVPLWYVICPWLPRVVAPRVGQPVTGDADSPCRISEHPSAAEIASFSWAEKVPQSWPMRCGGPWPHVVAVVVSLNGHSRDAR
eukprot:6772904-Pyramimonas_sp.AAC.1